MTLSPREPTADQLRAVADALDKVLARGRWKALSPVLRSLPAHFFVRWVDPECPEPGFPFDHAHAALFTFNDPNRMVLALRVDRTPEELHLHVLHELQHAADHQW